MVAHGKVNYSWHGNILQLDVFGPFNVIGINNAFEELKKQVSTHFFEKWYRIDVIDDETLGCPEVMKTIGQTYVWSLENNCQMIAIVYANRVQLSLLNAFIEKSGLNVRAFTNREDALATINALSK
ncbi:hypothetical protein [Pseudoalteromonas spongiae]|uniref:hypothetical protein n=1 Tax=Pseudoalteromonas spongiae TaxID=298657 RepID=UPI00110BC251|nr:hypothetical protein [Pseudoalteromonas spongiae]TMO87097.1 hypothetical protein CWC15_04210 [Pseudoalteromonas spongiae]